MPTYRTQTLPQPISYKTTSVPVNNIINIRTVSGGGGGGSTTDYTQLINKPSIESVTLIGNKTFPDLGLQPIDTDDLLEILV